MSEKVIRRRAGKDPRSGERAEEMGEFPTPGEIPGPSSLMPRAVFLTLRGGSGINPLFELPIKEVKFIGFYRC